MSKQQAVFIRRNMCANLWAAAMVVALTQFSGCSESQLIHLSINIEPFSANNEITVSRVHVVNDGSIYSRGLGPVLKGKSGYEMEALVNPEFDCFVVVDLVRNDELLRSEIYLIENTETTAGPEYSEWRTPNGYTLPSDDTAFALLNSSVNLEPVAKVGQLTKLRLGKGGTQGNSGDRALFRGRERQTIAGASRLSGVCGTAARQLKLARQVIAQLGTDELPNGRTFGGTDRIQTAVRGGLSDGGRA